MIITRKYYCAAAFILSLVCAVPAYASSTLIVSPSGENVYQIQGAGIDGAAAIEATLSYDTAVYMNPRVQQGAMAAGAMMAVNPNVPGSIRIALIRTTPLNGNGIIASITFDRRSDAPGKITACTARLTNLDGKAIPVAVQIVNPSDQPAVAAVPAPAAQSSSAGSSGAAPAPVQAPGAPPVLVVPGTVIAREPGTPEAGKDPNDVAGKGKKETPDMQAPEQKPVTAKTPESHETSTALKGIPGKTVYTQKSVLERFRDHRGELTPKKLMSLFEQDGMIGFRQEPPIAFMADKAKVKVIFIAAGDNKVPSDIAVSGARLLSVKRDPDYTNTWIAELELLKGELTASVTIMQDKLIMLYPLTIALKADISLGRTPVTEDDFKLFLRERGTRKAPKYDLNGDGKRDHVDDFLFTANYLVLQQSGAGVKQPEKGAAGTGVKAK